MVMGRRCKKEIEEVDFCRWCICWGFVVLGGVGNIGNRVCSYGGVWVDGGKDKR